MVEVKGICPCKKPEYKREDAEKLLSGKKKKLDKAYLIGFRGYYANTFGVPAKNDIGVYDDAIILITPTHYSTYNANCDPSKLYKDVATLCAGIWVFTIGTHNISKEKSKQYKALVQGSQSFLLKRHGSSEAKYETWRGINIHRGGETTTSSAGCQTIVSNQWDTFIKNVEEQMQKYNQSKIEYILIDLA